LVTPWLRSQEPTPLPDLGELERVLLVHVSQRLGNTLLVTPGLTALLDRLCGARVVFVGGSHASAVLEGHGFDRVKALSRAESLHPWRFYKTLRWVRAQRFDAAIHLGTSSRSIGPLLVGLSGARHRIGRQREGTGVFFTAPLPQSTARHKVDAALDLVGSLGVPAKGERRMLLRADEIEAAEAQLRSRIGDNDRRPIGLFVGGRARKGKDWSLSNFGTIARGVRARGIPLVVFLGPEEGAHEQEIRHTIGEAIYVDRESVRRVASLVACCGAVLSLDTGPMHLAIAVGAPMGAVFRKPNFDRWGPRVPPSEVIYDREGTGARRALETLLRLYDEPRRRKLPSGCAAPILGRAEVAPEPERPWKARPRA
jgi:ADP-heptose:LPS heptosyltransferase